MQALARVRQDAVQRLQMGNDTPDHLYLQIQIQTGSRYFSKIHLHVKNACLSLNVAWWCSWILCSSTARWLSRRQGIVPVSTIFHQSPPAGGHVTTMSPKLHQCHQWTPLYVPWPDQWGGRAYVLGGLLSCVIQKIQDIMIDNYPGARARSHFDLLMRWFTFAWIFFDPTIIWELVRVHLLPSASFSQQAASLFPAQNCSDLCFTASDTVNTSRDLKSLHTSDFLDRLLREGPIEGPVGKIKKAIAMTSSQVILQSR